MALTEKQLEEIRAELEKKGLRTPKGSPAKKGSKKKKPSLKKDRDIGIISGISRQE